MLENTKGLFSTNFENKIAANSSPKEELDVNSIREELANFNLNEIESAENVKNKFYLYSQIYKILISNFVKKIKLILNTRIQIWMKTIMMTTI